MVINSFKYLQTSVGLEQDTSPDLQIIVVFEILFYFLQDQEI